MNMKEMSDILIVKIRENCLMCDMTLQRLDELGISYKTEITIGIAPILVKNGRTLQPPFNTSKLKKFLSGVDTI